MKKSVTGALALAGAAALILGAGASAHAIEDPTSTSQEAYRIVALGDSYTAGNGAGDYYGPTDAYRSHDNYGSVYTAWLAEQPDLPVQYTSYAASGNTTNAVLATQIPQVDADTDLVMFTIGGDDVFFADIVENCNLAGARSESSCKDSVNTAKDGLTQVMTNTWSIFEQLSDRLSTDAEIVLVGYPYLVQDVTYHLCDWDVWCFGDDEYDVTTNLRALTDSANALQTSLVDSWNDQDGVPHATFVKISDAFDGHEPAPGVTTSSNEHRWMQQFFETETIEDPIPSETTSSFSDTDMFWYHPGVTGHQQIAAQLEAVVGVPANAQALQTANAAAAATSSGPTTSSLSAMAAPTNPAPDAYIVDDWSRPIGSTITFDARGSVAGTGSIEQYDWDFDGDGTFDQTSLAGTIDHTFDAAYDGLVTVRVTQTDGQTDTASANVLVSADGDSTPDALDNCPDVYNYSQSDHDSDGTGDECDDTPGYPTSDTDGVYERTDATTLALSTETVAPGSALTVTASGFTPGDTVEIWMHSDPVLLATATVAADGSLSVTVTVPTDADPGTHSVMVADSAVYDLTGLIVDETLAVTEDDPEILPATGGELGGWLIPAGLVALAAGAAVFLIARRRSA